MTTDQSRRGLALLVYSHIQVQRICTHSASKADENDLSHPIVSLKSHLEKSHPINIPKLFHQYKVVVDMSSISYVYPPSQLLPSSYRYTLHKFSRGGIIHGLVSLMYCSEQNNRCALLRMPFEISTTSPEISMRLSELTTRAYFLMRKSKDIWPASYRVWWW